ncbi:HAD-IIB family hydrolase [Microbacterium sp. NPDC091662]|uniref:HAD-IIB family hydrolase n=1 Tax=Microbacterium sp. NPDC091662 TaxID=3364211 RepID=UPI00382212F0
MNTIDTSHALFVSDLDGTLLNANRQITERTAQAVNRLIELGGLFAIATARMPHSCRDRLAPLNLELPAIVMNGAALYSFAQARFIHWYPISRRAVEHVQDAITRHNAGAFIYAIHDGKLRIGYTRDTDLLSEQYNTPAAHADTGQFTELGPTDWQRLGEIIYIAVVGDDNTINQVATDLTNTSDVQLLPYRNIYTETDCLEIASTTAGKHNAIELLLSDTGATSLVAFGDNHNDLAMMAIADVSLAPVDAIDDARNAADIIIQSHDSDGVAKILETRFIPALRPAASASNSKPDPIHESNLR